MLYLNVEVNGHKVKALVDSGAQATIMSPECADACGISRLIDTRFSGVARGVGTAKIIGRVHTAQIKIGNLFLPCSFTVMEGKSVDLLLGLDMLKRYQACIDLEKGCLVIQGENVPFLGEADIPKAEEELLEEPTVLGPSGTQIGQRSGAVVSAESQQQPAEPTQPEQTAPLQQAPTQNTGGDTTGVSPQHIESLIQMGADRSQAIGALQATGDDVDMAAGILFFG
jgi:DNA damage-inducible protein 1